MITISKKVINYVLQYVMAAAFLFFGVMKFIQAPADGAEVFGGIGGAAAQYFTGVFEVVSAILVAIPATAVIGAILIAITMAVALVLHLTGMVGAAGMIPVAIVFLVISGYYVWANKEKIPFLK